MELLLLENSSSTLQSYGNSANNTRHSIGEMPTSGHYHFAKIVETYFVPVTCVVGIISNSLAVKTFLDKSLRKYSCSIYLIAKCASETLFLLNLFGIYIGGCFDFNLHTAKNICQIVIFISYVSGFISVWTVILVTFENFIRIRFPFEVKRICTTRNSNIGICVLIVFALGIYNFSLWISDGECKPVPEYSKLTQAFVYIDTLLTLILPSILLSILILIIITRLLTAHRKNMFHASELSNRLVNRPKNTTSKIAVVTKMLLSVSLSFFLLTVTSHIVRIKLLIIAFMNGEMILSDSEAAVQIIAQVFYYASMSINLFIFLLFGDNFRKVFKTIFLGGTQGNLNVSETERLRRPEENMKTTLCYEDKAVEVTERDLYTYMKEETKTTSL